MAAKRVEDSDYADRLLNSDFDEPKQILVQVTHFEKRFVGELRRSGQARSERDVPALFQDIRESIMKKATVQPSIKHRTLLLLITPAPLGNLLKAEAEKEEFDNLGFHEIWISAWHEEPFPLRLKTG